MAKDISNNDRYDNDICNTYQDISDLEHSTYLRYINHEYFFDIKNKTQEQRRDAIHRYFKETSPLKLFRKINVSYVLCIDTDPDLAKIYKEDLDYIKSIKEYLDTKN
jgi:hypothetical protein